MLDSTELTKLLIEQRLDKVNTTTVGKVIKYNAEQQTVDVEPLVKRTYSDGFALTNVVLVDVPLQFPSGGSGQLSFPMKEGDNVLLLYCDKEINSWKSSTGEEQVATTSKRKFNRADAVAIAGVAPTSYTLQPHADNVELKFTDAGSAIKLIPDGSIEISQNDETKLTINADGTFTFNGKATFVDSAVEITNSNVAVTGGDVVADGISLKTHTHAYTDTIGVVPTPSVTLPPT